MESAKLTFGRRLRLIRKIRGLTLEELGELASIGFKHVAAIERGQKTASFEAIDRLSAALNVWPYELFLPYESNDPRIHQSFKQLTRELEQHGSPALKQTLITLLPLLEQLEGNGDGKK